jgi:hypothetical protein
VNYLRCSGSSLVESMHLAMCTYVSAGALISGGSMNFWYLISDLLIPAKEFNGSKCQMWAIIQRGT